MILGALTKYLMRGRVVKKGQKSSDIIYGLSLEGISEDPNRIFVSKSVVPVNKVS